jgi:hypothetical protein
MLPGRSLFGPRGPALQNDRMHIPEKDIYSGAESTKHRQAAFYPRRFSSALDVIFTRAKLSLSLSFSACV